MKGTSKLFAVEDNLKAKTNVTDEFIDQSWTYRIIPYKIHKIDPVNEQVNLEKKNLRHKSWTNNVPYIERAPMLN